MRRVWCMITTSRLTRRWYVGSGVSIARLVGIKDVKSYKHNHSPTDSRLQPNRPSVIEELRAPQTPLELRPGSTESSQVLQDALKEHGAKGERIVEGAQTQARMARFPEKVMKFSLGKGNERSLFSLMIHAWIDVRGHRFIFPCTKRLGESLYPSSTSLKLSLSNPPRSVQLNIPWKYLP